MFLLIHINYYKLYHISIYNYQDINLIKYHFQALKDQYPCFQIQNVLIKNYYFFLHLIFYYLYFFHFLNKLIDLNQ